MNRYQKKCLVASLLMHGLLLLVLVVGTAFFNSEKKLIESPNLITVLNGVVTDGKSGGANPTPASATPAVAAPTPKPEPIKPAPPQPEPEKQRVVEPPKPKPTERKETVSELPVPKKPKKTLPEPISKTAATVSPKPPRPTRNIDISKPTVRDNKEKLAAAEVARLAADQRVRNERLAAFNGIRKNIENNLSPGTTIEMPSGAGGGQAEINYGDLVLSKYDAAWFAPSEVDDSEAIVKARVVIARNGRVISSAIIKASGNVTLDSSVRRALELRDIGQPFPAGSTDSQRTYIINFNLKTKRGLG